MRLSDFLNQIFAQPKSRIAQSGQAVVEYILVLIVTVSIILGILYQFNDAFRNFLNSYFGDYIACLLETGELPSLGGQGPNQDECNTGFEAFSVANGRPKIPMSNSSGSTGGNGSSSDSSDSSGSGGTGTSGSSSSNLRPSRVSSVSGTSNADSASRRGNLGNRPAVQPLNSRAGNLGESSGFGGDAAADGGGGRRRIRRRTIYLGEEYLSAEAKLRKDRVVAKGQTDKKARGYSSLRSPRFQLELPKPSAPLAADTGMKFSLAFFLKFLLIGGIIIALFIFLGGQFLQIKKSWQKGE